MHIIPLAVGLIIGGAGLSRSAREDSARGRDSDADNFTEPMSPPVSFARGDRLFELLRGKLAPKASQHMKTTMIETLLAVASGSAMTAATLALWMHGRRMLHHGFSRCWSASA
jgi:hypothetical protein